jgi:hypothetical protein
MGVVHVRLRAVIKRFHMMFNVLFVFAAICKKKKCGFCGT